MFWTYESEEDEISQRRRSWDGEEGIRGAVLLMTMMTMMTNFANGEEVGMGRKVLRARWS